MPLETPAEKASDDRAWMARALVLAARGEGLASPNPMVGAVLVRDGQLIAAATTHYNGVLHAETRSLETAAGNV